MKKEIFRKEALERMSSPEQLDELMPVTSPRGWLALAGLGSLLAVAIMWSVAGRIETSAKANGAFVRDGGMQLITASQDGEVAEVFVDVGSTVKPGDKLVRISFAKPGGPPKLETLVSQGGGRVLYVSTFPGDVVRRGSLLLSIESPDRPMQVILYVSAKNGYQVQPGQSVRVTPSTSDRYSARVLIGTVKSAGRFPESRDSIFRTLQNADWVNQLMQQGLLLEVVVQLPQGDDVSHLFNGTPCTAEIIVSRRRPIEFVFPFLSK